MNLMYHVTLIGAILFVAPLYIATFYLLRRDGKRDTQPIPEPTIARKLHPETETTPIVRSFDLGGEQYAFNFRPTDPNEDY